MAALTFPLALTDFFDDVGAQEVTFQLGEALEVSETAGGEIITSDHGVRLWFGTVSLWGRQHADIDDILARLELLQGADRSFFVSHARKPNPANDPAGTVLSGSSLTLDTVQSNNREVTVGGFPVGYVVRRGDLMSWSYGSSPTRYALHRAVTTATADGLGSVDVELNPPLRGSPTGAAVTMLQPSCKAILVPGSIRPASYDRKWGRGISFAWKQTLS